MRRIRIFAHVSLDGFISTGNEDGDYGDWTARYRSPAGAAALLETQGTGFDLLLGRRTYDLWSDFWPKAPSSPFADRLNAATKYVVTDRSGLEWGPADSLGADILQGIRCLKSSDGPDLLVWGSTTLTPVLFEHGLVDEVILIVCPILLGRGKRFFSDSASPRELALVNTTTTPTGVLLNTFRHVGVLQKSSQK